MDATTQTRTAAQIATGLTERATQYHLGEIDHYWFRVYNERDWDEARSLVIADDVMRILCEGICAMPREG